MAQLSIFRIYYIWSMLSKEEHFNSNQEEYKEAFLLRVLVEAQSSGGNNGNPVGEVADNIRISFLPSRVIDFARGWRGRRLRWWRDGIPKKGGQKIKVSGSVRSVGDIFCFDHSAIHLFDCWSARLEI